MATGADNPYLQRPQNKSTTQELLLDDPLQPNRLPIFDSFFGTEDENATIKEKVFK